MTTDKSPRSSVFLRGTAKDVSGQMAYFSREVCGENAIEYIHIDAYLAVKKELEHAQKIAWDRKCEVRKLQSRFEKCEGLLREFINSDDNKNSDWWVDRFKEYFADLETLNKWSGK